MSLLACTCMCVCACVIERGDVIIHAPSSTCHHYPITQPDPKSDEGRGLAICDEGGADADGDDREYAY